MIRPFTFLCMLLAGGAGLYLYQVKHRTRMLELDIDHLLQETRTVREHTGILQAEWAFLNDPARLQALADANLSLKTMAAGQFVQMSELDRRLPPVIVPPAAPAGGDDTDVVADGGAAPPAPALAQAAAPAPAVSSRPVLIQAASAAVPPPPRKPPALAGAPGLPPLSATAPSFPAPSLAPPRPVPSEREAVASALARRPLPPNLPAATQGPVVAARVRYAPYAAAATAAEPAGGYTPRAVPASGSALGSFHSSLPPPVPISVLSPQGAEKGR